jgi:hypothetical protein
LKFKTVKNGIHKNIILFVILCGFETLSLTLRQRHRLTDLEQGAEENICTEEG